VFIENFRPGTLDKMGLGYAVLKEVNPAIILCSISGFGQQGPEAKRLAYTDIVQAYSGLDHAASTMIGGHEDPPGFPVSFGDSIASLNAAIAILAALYNRELTGEGRQIDISMLDCLIASNDSTLQKYIFSNGKMDDPGMAFRPPLKMKDGHMAVAIALTFNRVVKVINRPELLQDERFSTIAARIENFDIYYQIVKEWASERTIAQASETLDQYDIPYGKVNSTAEILKSDLVLRRNMLVNLELPGFGEVPVINTPFKISGKACGPQGPPPRLGEHNRIVLREVLSLSESEMAELISGGVIPPENIQ
jgi:CoA:oxalate CoA-transferase